MIAEYLEKSAKELANELGEKWNLSFVIEKELIKMLALRDAEILSKIAMMKVEEKLSDTIRPKNDV